MVAVTSMNLIDVQAIVSNVMLGDRARSVRLSEQTSVNEAEIAAFQALNTSLLSVATAADAITESASWVPTTIASSDASVATAYASSGAVAGASPYPFTVTTIVEEGSDTATITYTKNDALQTVTSSSNTFTGLADFPGMTITVSAVDTENPVTLTPSATTVTDASVMTSAVSSLVTALNNSLALITSQISATGALDTEYTPRDISQQLLNTAWDANTLASLSNAGVELTRTGSFTFVEATLTTALAGASAEQVIGQVAAFAARVVAVTDAATSVTGAITREISTRQGRVSELTNRITEMTTDMANREKALTIYYSELNAKIQALQNQQSYLKTQLDVFTKALTVNR
jgi:flagellar hook-associated protein 2